MNSRFLPLGLVASVATSVATARADDAPPVVHALVVHVAPASSALGEPVQLEAMIDAPYAESLSVRWRAIGEPTWHDATFERSSAGGWFASLPPTAPPGLEYFIRGKDAAGAEVLHFASAEAPHVVRVDPDIVDRLEDLDLVRLAGRRNQIAVDFMAHDFGNRFDQEDYFLRGEVTYTHRLLRTIHHIAFGFGTIAGKTPRDSTPTTMGVLLDHGERYGFGEVRLRAHRSVFVDLRVALGASYDGFDQGVRGAVTFGKPWRSCVQLGMDYLGDAGGTGWVRLQWDTAPPLVMGASVVRTDLPGAVIDSAGLYVAYDVAYRFADRMTVKGQVSYGARDGVAHVGGGLGTAVDF